MARQPNPLRSPDLFVGRRDHLDRLASILGEGRSALLVGGRRTGKTTLARRLTASLTGRTVVFTDASGWDLSTEEAALGAVLSALHDRPQTSLARATRDDLLKALTALSPLVLVVDEADRIFTPAWGPGFLAFVRWLDDSQLRTDLSFLLIGGPVLVLFTDPEDQGSPPLNTAEETFIEPLDRDAVGLLTAQVEGADLDETLRICGGQAWLTTRVLAEMRDGAPFADAVDRIGDASLSAFQRWERQLGPDGRKLVRTLPSGGLSRTVLRGPAWSPYHDAARLARAVGALRFDGDRLCRGPAMFTDWLIARDSSALAYDLAISYASADEAVAREIYSQLSTEFKVFFAPAESAALWGTDLHRVLPHTYGVQARYVLVVSTEEYVSRYWTRVEFDAVSSRAPGRILLLDLGRLPADLPTGLVYRGGSAAELIGLSRALRGKLASPPG